MAASPRRRRVPETVLERAREVAPAVKRQGPAAAGAKAKVAPREKVIAALKRLKSHPMD
jgi:hypothetical protein